MVEAPAGDIRSDDEVARSIVHLYALEQAVRRRLLAEVAEYQRREAYRSDGARDMSEWLSESLSMTRAHAHELVRVATTIGELPALDAAYSEGELSWDQLVPVLSVADPATDAELASEAPKHSPEQCRRLARRMRGVSAAQALAAHRKRYLRWWWDDQCLRLSGSLPDADGAAVAKALTQLAEGMPLRPVTPSFEARCADGLVQLSSTPLGDDADRATVVVHADAADLFGEGGGELEDGPPVAAQTLRRLACDARWQLLAERPDGEAVGVGRSTRTVPPWMLRQLKRRDGGCRFPGCGRQRWLHAHHLEHWADGGRTDPDNLVMLCGTHHRMLHEEGWKTSGTTTALHVMAPSGRQMTSYPVFRYRM